MRHREAGSAVMKKVMVGVLLTWWLVMGKAGTIPMDSLSACKRALESRYVKYAGAVCINSETGMILTDGD